MEPGSDTTRFGTYDENGRLQPPKVDPKEKAEREKKKKQLRPRKAGCGMYLLLLAVVFGAMIWIGKHPSAVPYVGDTVRNWMQAVTDFIAPAR